MHFEIGILFPEWLKYLHGKYCLVSI
jgi:hypothetical protein